jgi:hypothetical protein
MLRRFTKPSQGSLCLFNINKLAQADHKVASVGLQQVWH